MLIKTKEFQITAPALLFDPEYYLFDFNPDRDVTRFLIVQEKNLSLAPFVDIRFEPLAQGQFSVSTKELFALEKMHDVKRPASAFIFHHAFVCSTLLARCMNQIDAFFSLKEPWILRRLSDYKRSQGQMLVQNKWREMINCNLNLLGRNYASGITPVIKVTNVANNLFPDILQSFPSQKILYLYSDLRSFLVSNLKKPRDTQAKMPGLAHNFLADGNFAQQFPQYSNINQLSFLQVCAVIWLVNLYNFKHSTEQFKHSNVKTLEMNSFLADMGRSLTNLSNFFGHQATATQVDQMLDPQITRTDAKHQNVSYDRDSKRTQMNQVITNYGNEIDKVLQWIDPLVRDLGVLAFCKQRKLGV